MWSSADGIEWTCELRHAPWCGRQFHSVAVFDGRLWLVGGSRAGELGDVWYSNDGLEWQEIVEVPWRARHAGSLFVHHNVIWLVGGSHLENDIWVLEKVAASENDVTPDHCRLARTREWGV